MNIPARTIRNRLWLRPWMIAAAIAVAVSITLNLVAATLGHSAPWLLGINLTLALLALGASILGVARLASQAEAKASIMRHALDESEARLEAIVDSAMDAIITVDEQQQIVLFNRAAEQLFRCSREDVLGRPLDRFLPSRFRAGHRGHIDRFGHTGVTSRRMGDVTTLWAVRADDGSEFPIEASISQATEGDRRFYTVILRDITVRKQNEDELRQGQIELRRLSAQVQEAREEEKTRIARELHDELGQLLTAVKMDLGWMRERIDGADTGFVMKAEKMNETLDQLVSSVRRIAADLRPLMLDDLGLPDAAAWLVEDFEKRSGIKCEVRIANQLETHEFERNIANTVYRALQESLTNIVRHAEARNAWIVLQIQSDAIWLEVEDNGLGVSAADLAKSKSLGLKGMRERIFHVGGSLEVVSPPRGGTRVSVHIPLGNHGAEAGK